MTADEMKAALESHAAWCAGTPGGMRADLRGANLRGANLCGANLRDANLCEANLQGANLRDANLSWSDLRWADLSETNLREANLRGADLCVADLRGANLRGTNLRGANLDRANLSLSGVSLRGANLSEANLRGANFGEAGMDRVAAARLRIVPAEGVFVGWKRCRNDVIVKLQIAADARRSNATGRSCRAERVNVLEVIGADTGVSVYDGKTQYVAGKTVECDRWCENRWVESGGGIHFYLTREEAEAS